MIKVAPIESKNSNQKVRSVNFQRFQKSNRATIRPTKRPNINLPTRLKPNDSTRTGQTQGVVRRKRLTPAAAEHLRARTLNKPATHRLRHNRRQDLATHGRRQLKRPVRRKLKPDNVPPEPIMLPAIRLGNLAPALMIYFSFFIGLLTVLLHGLDLAIGWPFHRASVMYDSVCIICGTIFIALTWHTYRERERRTSAAT